MAQRVLNGSRAMGCGRGPSNHRVGVQKAPESGGVMLVRVVGHIRRQPVAYIALFFALGGGAMGASTLIRSTDTISSGDLAGSTYGSPKIASGAVTNGKLAHSSLTLSPGEGLTGGGSISLGGSGTLSVEPSVVQSRVGGTCSSGQALSSINQDGSVSCAGARVVAGLVNFDGSISSGSGFTVSHPSTGSYVITFSAGTWKTNTVPAITVTPFFFLNVFAIGTDSAGNDGSATVSLEESSATNNPSLTDGTFSFIAAQT
jgi:hypothetical protein